MAQDTQYTPVPFIYKSRGAVARPILDQAPEYTYLQLLNGQEREENSMSSRYGTMIINRDPLGGGISNHFFSSPVTSLARLAFQGDSFRYAGLSNGTLQRRGGDSQGAYGQIYTGLSGEPFGSIVTNCYETSQPFLFIYDQNLSIKDMGTSSPQLTGIDAPQLPPTAVPYSPLLTLIDNFASGNFYSVTNVTGWAYSTIVTLTSSSSQLVTDFTEFFGVGPGGGGSTTYNLAGIESTSAMQSGPGSTTNTSSVLSGFPSVAIGAGQLVTVTLTLSGSLAIVGLGGGGGIQAEVSPDGGMTWTSMYGFGGSTPTLWGPYTASATVSPVNLDQVQFRAYALAAAGAPGVVTTVNAQVANASATVSTVAAFGPVAQGMLSILPLSSPSIDVAITSVESDPAFIGQYLSLIVTTQTAHGRSPGDFISLYGCSNDLVDGFYKISYVVNAMSFAVDYAVPQGDGSGGGSGVFLSATGGFVHGGGSTPETCVLANQYSIPYPNQFSAWGFYQQVPLVTNTFPVSCWSGSIAASTTGTIASSGAFDLSINKQVTDDDLIVITLAVSNPENVTNIRLQFDVNGSGYTASYYYKDIAPAYYQGNIANQVEAYQATENQIIADTIGLITGAPPNTTTAQLQPGNISTGSGSWTAIYLRRGDFLPVGNAGQAGLDWSNITGWQVICDTGDSGSTTISINGIYLQWGYGPSSIGGVGYDYRYTYYDAATGTESSPSPEQYFDEQFGFLSTLSAPFYLRQAVQVIGLYSLDPQVTHVRIYRRGGILADNWRLIGEVVNNRTWAGLFSLFVFKDVIADAAIEQAETLVLDNDPPVTSSLVDPIDTSLGAATMNLYGSTYYQPAVAPIQIVTVADASAVFVPGQIVDVGNANTLEQVTVVQGGTGQFSAVLQLQHNAGEPVSAYSTPRAKCDLCAISNSGGVIQVWLAGDKNNPHYLYYSKAGRPENFGPENYIPVGSPDYPINAVINWRGSIIVGTTATWWIIVGGARPYPQPTGSQHGIVAKRGWIEVEGAIWYQAVDGLREFTGADGVYKSDLIEWVYRDQPMSLIPLADLSQLDQTIMAYYQGEVYTSYVSQNSGKRYRLIYNRTYARWRYDDIQATAMFWEKDTNDFLVGRQIGVGSNYAVIQDQVYTLDYDDGGWAGASLEQDPIILTTQLPYRDLGKPHFPKQWNMLETDVNTNGMTMATTLLFDDGDAVSPIVLANTNTGTLRKKVQFVITGAAPDAGDTGGGQQAYRMSIKHTFSVTKAPILYQEDIYAAQLADYNNSMDTYWIKLNTDRSKLIKQGYFDYTSPVGIAVNLFADNGTVPYFTFTLPAKTTRWVERVRFGNVNHGSTAFTCRLWRMTMLSLDTTVPFQMWRAPMIEFKEIQENHSYEVREINS